MEQPLGQGLFTEINAHLEAQGLRTGELLDTLSANPQEVLPPATP
jgi:hypothetical protein